MTNACTQNTDRECREEDCCLKTKKTRLIPFEWTKYKAGMKAICGDREVKQLYLFNCHHEYPLIGVLDNYLVSFTRDGKSNVLHGDYLFLEEELEDKTFYVNIYSDTSLGYKDLISAKMVRSSTCLGTLKITYTEEDLIK